MTKSRCWLALIGLIAAAQAPSAHAEAGLTDALIGGKPDLFLRYRYEFVDDGAPGLKNAHASTLRTALGYSTGAFHDFSAYLQLEDIRVIGNELFNDGGGNGVIDRAVVVDPQGTELNQALLRYAGLPRTVLTYGRQEITHREAPLHRFVGNILFRQNWQTFDAFRAINLSLPQSVIDYAYVWNVNRIFGEDNPLPNASDFRMHSHLLNIQYHGFSIAKLETYAYLLDFDSDRSRALSTATYGLRLQGDQTLSAQAKVSYAGEFATQQDYRNNPRNIDVNYAQAELGLNYAIGGRIESANLKLTYELLEGDGGATAFQTPLGTNHAFQGHADRFLVTPGDGIKDYFVTLGARAFGAQFSAIYHRFRSDRDHYPYGEEWNLVLQKPLKKDLLLGFEFADYKADRNALNVARNTGSGQAFDLVKFWAYLQFRY